MIRKWVSNRLFTIATAILLLATITFSQFASISPPASQEVGKPLLKTTFTVSISDASGKVVKSYTRPSDSYVYYFAEMLYCIASTNSPLNIPDTSNTLRTLTYNQGTYLNSNGSGSNAGIVVGTGTNAVALTNYALQTLIANGNGAGQLNYGAGTISTTSTTGTTRYFTISRTFKNNAAGSITVNECGIYCMATSTPYYFMWVRDLISPGQAVGAGQTLTLTYTIGITV
jgi:hypothetical protein